MPDDEVAEDTPLQQVAGGLVTVLTLLAAFGALALGVEGWWIFFVIGFAGLLPLAVGLTKLYESRRASASDATPADADEEALAALRRRYAAGEIDEAEFERRVERLLETESVADAREYVDRVMADVADREPTPGGSARSGSTSGDASGRGTGERATETDRER
jgi:uncharacterized membrane protein